MCSFSGAAEFTDRVSLEPEKHRIARAFERLISSGRYGIAAEISRPGRPMRLGQTVEHRSCQT